MAGTFKTQALAEFAFDRVSGVLIPPLGIAFGVGGAFYLTFVIVKVSAGLLRISGWI